MDKKKLIFEKRISLEESELLLNETLFHNANGYMGVRSNFEEGYKEGCKSIRGQYINGFYEFIDMNQAEKLYGLTEEKQTILNVADTQGIELFIDGERFSMFEGEVLDSSRILDMEQGYTMRRILWRSGKNHEVEISIKRMTSFVTLPLFTIDYSVTALNFEGDLKFVSSHSGKVMNYSDPNDPRVAAESSQYLFTEEAGYAGDISVIVSGTARSKLWVATAVRNILSVGCDAGFSIEGNTAVHSMTCHVNKGRTVSLVKYTVICDSIRYDRVKEAAFDIMVKSTSVPVRELYEQQKEYLDRYWESCAVDISGDDEMNTAVYYNLYQLIQSVGKDRFCNIAAKGLSGEGYEGHYFWDTEMYIQPFFCLTQPQISKNLIRHRYTLLESARENARILGHAKGALYPWRTIMGRECSGYFPSGSAQYHINGDIAYSIAAYYLMTKDLELMAECGAEIVFETARLWMDTGNYDGDRFVINDVTGPDEYTCIVNNNYYTNVIARYNLNWAVKLYGLLEENNALADIAVKIDLLPWEISGFEKAAEAMFLPYDAEKGINPQDDSFLSKRLWDIDGTPKENFPLLLHYHPLHLYRHQVCKQADTVMAHFILEDAQPLETVRNSFEYYEKITTHDSSLSTCIFSIVASRLGLREKAYSYFGESAKLDIFNTHKNTRDGIHTANMGGSYMTIVYGFGGFRVKEKGICFAPYLPEKWERYCFNILYEGSLIRTTVDRKGCGLELLRGAPKEVYVFGEKYNLDRRLDFSEPAAKEEK